MKIFFFISINRPWRQFCPTFDVGQSASRIHGNTPLWLDSAASKARSTSSSISWYQRIYFWIRRSTYAVNVIKSSLKRWNPILWLRIIFFVFLHPAEEAKWEDGEKYEREGREDEGDRERVPPTLGRYVVSLLVYLENLQARGEVVFVLSVSRCRTLGS